MYNAALKQKHLVFCVIYHFLLGSFLLIYFLSLHSPLNPLKLLHCIEFIYLFKHTVFPLKI